MGLSQRVSVEERKTHLFTVKIFLTQWDCSFIHTALDKSKPQRVWKIVLLREVIIDVSAVFLQP